MQRTKALPCTIFDHVVWTIQAADGSWRVGEILLGPCLFLFTSLDSVNEFLNTCEDRDESGLQPTVFSRSRKEFGRRARDAARQGVIGALFDPLRGVGEAPFLQFARMGRP